MASKSDGKKVRKTQKKLVATPQQTKKKPHIVQASKAEKMAKVSAVLAALGMGSYTSFRGKSFKDFKSVTSKTAVQPQSTKDLAKKLAEEAKKEKLLRDKRSASLTIFKRDSKNYVKQKKSLK